MAAAAAMSLPSPQLRLPASLCHRRVADSLAMSHSSYPLLRPTLYLTITSKSPTADSLNSGAPPSRAGTIEASSLTLPGVVMETERLPPDVRDSAMDIIEHFGRRVITDGVASLAGQQIDQALQAFAADIGASWSAAEFVKNLGMIMY